MTYSITTDGPEGLVTLSFEWKTDAPKVVGLYFRHDLRREAVFHYDIQYMEKHGFGVFEAGIFYPLAGMLQSRWLGPIPLPASGA